MQWGGAFLYFNFFQENNFDFFHIFCWCRVFWVGVFFVCLTLGVFFLVCLWFVFFPQ